jgi:hypothetical protein
MEQENQLVPQRHDLTAASKISLTASQQMLAVEIHLTALNAKTEAASELVAEFDRVFWCQPRAAVQYAFRRWRDTSSFFPAISDIRELITAWHQVQADLKEARKRREERERIEQARKKGELIEFATIKEMLAAASAGGVKPTYTPPPPEELRRRRDEQLAAVGAKDGTSKTKA